MPILTIIIYAVVQGITEFLPISSSGHLVLIPSVTGWQDQGLAIDVAVHVGTLLAVVLYFWRDLWLMVAGTARAVVGQRNPGARLTLQVAIATIPVIVMGFVFSDVVATMLRDPRVIAWATIGFGVLLYFADRFAMTIRRIEHMSHASAIVIGLSQALALIPGTSRSGVTMTFARILGFERTEAARFSMLLSIPTIAAAGALTAYDLYHRGDLQLTVDAAVAASLAFLFAVPSIWLLMRVVGRFSFTPFVVYRLLLGGLLLFWIYG